MNTKLIFTLTTSFDVLSFVSLMVFKKVLNCKVLAVIINCGFREKRDREIRGRSDTNRAIKAYWENCQDSCVVWFP